MEKAKRILSGFPAMVEYRVRKYAHEQDQLRVTNEQDNVVKFQDEVVNEVVNLDVPKSSRFIQGNDFMPSK